MLLRELNEKPLIAATTALRLHTDLHPDGDKLRQELMARIQKTEATLGKTGVNATLSLVN
jgi:hypothetical protein